MYGSAVNASVDKAKVFTARHVCKMSVRRSVCPSARLSVRHTPVLYVNGYTYPQSFFPPSGSPTILVFSHQTGWQYSDGDPPSGGAECKGYEKITIFDQYWPVWVPDTVVIE